MTVSLLSSNLVHPIMHAPDVDVMLTLKWWQIGGESGYER